MEHHHHPASDPTKEGAMGFTIFYTILALIIAFITLFL